MQDPFNPYQEWLGQSLSQPPRDHYELLGLEAFESDASKIRQAADGLISRVRSQRPGEHLREWQQLLDVLSQAKTDLLDPQAKAAYDAWLRSSGAYGQDPQPGAPTPPPNLATPPTLATPPNLSGPSSSSTAPPTPNAPSGPPANHSMAPDSPSYGPTSNSPHEQRQFHSYGQPQQYSQPPYHNNQPPQEYGHAPPASNVTGSGHPWASNEPQQASGDLSQSMGAWRKPGPFPGGEPQQGPYPTAPQQADPSPLGSQQPGYPTPGQQGPGQQGPGYQAPASAAEYQPPYSGPQPQAAQGQTQYPGYPSPASPANHSTSGPQGPPHVSGQPVSGTTPGLPQGGHPSPPMGTPVPSDDSAGPPMGAPVTPVGATPVDPATGQGPQHAGYGQTPSALGASETMVPGSHNPFSAADGPDRSNTSRHVASPPWWASSAFYVRLLVLVAILAGVTFLYVQRKGHLPFVAGNHVAGEADQPGDEREPADRDRQGHPDQKSQDSNPRESHTVAIPTDEAEPGSTPGSTKPNEREASEDSANGSGESKPQDARGPNGDNQDQSGKPNSEADKQQPTPEQQKAVAEKFTQARIAMAQRELDRASQLLADAAAMVQGPEQQAELDRLQLIDQRLGEFWDALRRFTANLDGGEELEIKDTRVAVVESSPHEIILKAAGRLRRYSVDDMPSLLVMAIADKTFANDPQSQLLYGVFLAMDPESDRGRARSLIASAVQSGLEKEKIILDELRIPLPAAVDAAGGGPGASTSGLPIPTDQAELQAAERDVRRTFEKDFDQATNPEAQTALAQTLLQASDSVGDAPAQRWVLLREARNLAVAAGEPNLACTVVDRMGAAFALDTLKAKATVLQGISDTVRSLQAHRDIVECALPMVAEAANSGQWDAAKQLAEVAVASGVRSKSPSLARQATAARRMVDQRRPAH